MNTTVGSVLTLGIVTLAFTTIQLSLPTSVPSVCYQDARILTSQNDTHVYPELLANDTVHTIPENTHTLDVGCKTLTPFHAYEKTASSSSDSDTLERTIDAQACTFNEGKFVCVKLVR